jgi:hypothetical protein
MKTISSVMTPFAKLVIPCVCVAAAVLFVTDVLPAHRDRWWVAIFLGSGALYIVWWAAAIKKVKFDGSSFVVSNYIVECAVPISHLASISEHPDEKFPNIVLEFDPPTRFGRKIRLIAPYDWRRLRLAQLVHEIRQAQAATRT